MPPTVVRVLRPDSHRQRGPSERAWQREPLCSYQRLGALFEPVHRAGSEPERLLLSIRDEIEIRSSEGEHTKT